MILMIRSFLVRQLYVWLLASYSARRIGEAPAVTSTIIVLGSTGSNRIRFFLLVRQLYVWLLASYSSRRIGGAPAVTSTLIMPRAPRSNRTRSSLLVRQLYAPWLLARRTGGAPAVTSTLIMPGTRIGPNTILPPRPAIVCPLATGATNRRITSRVRGSLPPQHIPNERAMIVVVVAVVSTLPLLSTRHDE